MKWSNRGLRGDLVPPPASRKHGEPDTAVMEVYADTLMPHRSWVIEMKSWCILFMIIMFMCCWWGMPCHGIARYSNARLPWYEHGTCHGIITDTKHLSMGHDMSRDHFNTRLPWLFKASHGAWHVTLLPWDTCAVHVMGSLHHWNFERPDKTAKVKHTGMDDSCQQPLVDNYPWIQQWLTSFAWAVLPPDCSRSF